MKSKYEYIYNSELEEPGRAKQLIDIAESILQKSPDQPISWDDMLVLFKALNACGYVLNHSKRGWAMGHRSKKVGVMRSKLIDVLVKENLGLICEMSRRFRVGLDTDDMLSTGMSALYNSVLNFNPWKGIKFSTYACISIHRRLNLLYRQFGRHTSRYFSNADEVISHKQCEEGKENLIHLCRLEKLKRVLDENHADLTSQERFVIEQRFFSGERVTLRRIGQIINLTRERARQIQTSALLKLHLALTGKERVVKPKKQKGGRRKKGGPKQNTAACA